MTNNSRKYEYDKSGNLIKITTKTAEREQETSYTYDWAGRTIAEIGVDGSVNMTIYNLAGKVAGILTPKLYEKAVKEGVIDTLAIKRQQNVQADMLPPLSRMGSYAAENVMHKKIDESISLEKQSPVNLLAKACQSTDLLTQISCYHYEYDNMGRLLTITAPDKSLLQKNSYHANGLLKSQHDGAGSGIHFTYDLAGRQLQAQTELGSYQKYTYNPWGIITGVEDGNGNQTTYDTDIWGRITQIHKADGSKEQYEYDNAGNIAAVIDGNGNRREYMYNWRNQPEIIIDSQGAYDIFTYDEEGNLHSHTDRNGIRTIHEYNMYGDLTEKYVEGGTLRESYHYTAEGMLKYAIGGGMRYDYTYDNMGRLHEKKASGRTLLRYQYDLNGNIAQRTDFTGKTTTYQYNILDQLTEVYDNGIRQALYEYEAGGNLIRQTIGEDVITEYSYDADHNLIALKTTLAGMKKPYAENSSILPIASGITSPETALPQEKAFHTEAPQVLVDNHYTYDGNGNRLTKQTLNGINTYQFDALNRLIHVAYPTYSEAFRYDGAGNRTHRTILPTPQSQPLNGYHSNVGKEKAMTADTLQNLPRAISQQYSYDAEGLRAEMVENGELVKFLFAGREVVAETEADGNVIRYIRGYDLISSDSEKAKTYYHYASDEQGSITHLVSGIEKIAETDIATGISYTRQATNTSSIGITNHDQNVSLEDRILNRYEYDAFGNTIYSEEKVQNRFRYTGQQCDPLTQQYYLRARYYNPVIARFTQEDTYHGDGLNLYSYCSNNPLMYYDPSGHAGQVCPDKYDLYRIYREKGLSVEKARDAADAYKKKYGDYDPKHEFEVEKENTSKSTRNSNDKHKKQPNNVKESGSSSTLFDTFVVQPGRNIDLNNPSAPNNRSYITYVFRNQSGEIVYVGRASGKGNPVQVMKGRISKGHDHFKLGYSYEIIATQTNKLANQGAEEFFILGYQEMGMLLENITPSLSYRSDRVGKTMNKIEAFFEDLFR